MDAWLERKYQQHGDGFIVRALLLLIPFALVFLPLLVALPAHYYGLTTGEWLLTAAASIVAFLLLGGGVIVGVGRRSLSPLFAWAAGERSAELLQSADEWAYRAPRRLVAIAIALAAGVIGPMLVSLVVAQSEFRTLGDIAGVAIGVYGTVVAMLLAAYFMVELTLRPVRASIGATGMPAVGNPAGSVVTLIATPLFLGFLAAGGVGYVTTDRAASGSLLEVWAISLGITAMVSVPFLIISFGSALGPIRALTRAHREVAAGALPQIPVVSTDELGELTASFNQMVAELKRTEGELRASRARIVAAADDSRRRVERDLHDGAQQSLVLLHLKLGLIARQLESDPVEAVRGIEECRGDMEAALEELRDLAHGIYPSVLVSDGLATALADAAETAGIAAKVVADGVGRHAPEIEAAVYFCCLEALQNAVKHAGPDASAEIRLMEVNGVLRFKVADTGAGFDPAAADGSAGLQNMSDRMGALGGSISVASAPGAGTAVRGSIPVQTPAIGQTAAVL